MRRERSWIPCLGTPCEQYYISSQGIQILSQQGYVSFLQIDMMEYDILQNFVDGMPLKNADKVAFLSLIRRRNQSTESDQQQVALHEDEAKPITSRHREIIRKSFYNLSRFLKIVPLLIQLVSMGTITQEDMELCRSKPTPLEQGYELFNHFTERIGPLFP